MTKRDTLLFNLDPTTADFILDLEAQIEELRQHLGVVRLAKTEGFVIERHPAKIVFESRVMPPSP